MFVEVLDLEQFTKIFEMKERAVKFKFCCSFFESINTTIDYYIKKEDEQELKKSINRIDFFKDVV